MTAQEFKEKYGLELRTFITSGFHGEKYKALYPINSLLKIEPYVEIFYVYKDHQAYLSIKEEYSKWKEERQRQRQNSIDDNGKSKKIDTKIETYFKRKKPTNLSLKKYLYYEIQDDKARWFIKKLDEKKMNFAIDDFFQFVDSELEFRLSIRSLFKVLSQEYTTIPESLSQKERDELESDYYDRYKGGFCTDVPLRFLLDKLGIKPLENTNKNAGEGGINPKRFRDFLHNTKESDKSDIMVTIGFGFSNAVQLVPKIRNFYSHEYKKNIKEDPKIVIEQAKKRFELAPIAAQFTIFTYITLLYIGRSLWENEKCRKKLLENGHELPEGINTNENSKKGNDQSKNNKKPEKPKKSGDSATSSSSDETDKALQNTKNQNDKDTLIDENILENEDTQENESTQEDEDTKGNKDTLEGKGTQENENDDKDDDDKDDVDKDDDDKDDEIQLEPESSFWQKLKKCCKEHWVWVLVVALLVLVGSIYLATSPSHDVQQEQSGEVFITKDLPGQYIFAEMESDGEYKNIKSALVSYNAPDCQIWVMDSAKDQYHSLRVLSGNIVESETLGRGHITREAGKLTIIISNNYKTWKLQRTRKQQ